MDNTNKSKEELIIELHKLQQAHDSLKAKIEANLHLHRLTEKELRASEERFQLLFNKAPLGYQSLDFDGNFIEVNQQWLETLGYEREEVIGKWFGDFLTPVFMVGFRERFPIFKAQGQIHSEFEMLHKNGSVLFIAFDGRIGYDIKGDFKQTHCILQDISQRKQIEEKLIRSEKELKKAQEITHIGSWYLNIATNEVAWTEELYRMYGFDPALPVPPYTEHKKLFTPESWEILSKSLAHTASTGIPYELELRTVKNDGSNGWMWVKGETVADNEGKTIGLWGAAQDISRRKEMEEALQKSEENLSTTLHSIGDGVISTDINGFIVQINPIAEKLCGWKLTDAIGKPLPEVFKIINAESRQTVVNPVEKVLENGEIIGLANHTVLISKGGNEYQISDSAAPIKNKEGVITGVVLVFSDVSESYAAQKQIQESEERMRGIYTIAPAGIGIVVNRVLKEVNPLVCEMTGYTREELLEKDAVMLYPSKEEYDFVGREKYRQISETGTGRLETLWKKKDGTLINIILSSTPIDSKDLSKGTIFTALDITERKQAEEALRKSEEMMLSSQSVAHICSYSTNLNVNELDRSVWECSPEFYKIFGIDKSYPHTIAGWAGFIHPDHREELVAYHEYVVKNRIPFSHEYKIIRINDGEERWVQGTGEFVYDESGKPVRMHGAIQDITERKHSEEALCKSEAIKNKMVSNIGDVIVIIDKDGINRYKSPNIEKWFGWKPEDLVGKSTWDAVHPEDLESCKSFIQSLAGEHNASGKIELRYRKKDGSYCPIEIAIVNLLQDPNIQGFLGNYHNISERKKAEQELITAKEHAEESDRLKSAFLANMSHEIRTPMNGILGFAELLKEQGLTGEQQQKYIRIIEKSGARMLNIINDIIDISKIESGLMKLDKIETNINEQIEYIYTFFKPEVEAKGMKLSFNAPLTAQEATITTDREKVYAILTNLVKNAIKYSNKGIIEIGYTIVETLHARSLLQFYVKDNGIGIPKDRHEAIFERFVQADITDKMAHQGAGLGLSITRAYVEMLGGKIWVESDHDLERQGSTFYFTLPYKTEPARETVAQQFATLDKTKQIRMLKILIAEDDEISEMLLDETLKMFGEEILKVRTGIEAVEACKKNPDIDLVLMDIQMPEMGGHEATRQIREFNKEVVIIAQTAYGISGDREKAIEAGCNDYISKPINVDILFALILKYFKG